MSSRSFQPNSEIKTNKEQRQQASCTVQGRGGPRLPECSLWTDTVRKGLGAGRASPLDVLTHLSQGGVKTAAPPSLEATGWDPELQTHVCEVPQAGHVGTIPIPHLCNNKGAGLGDLCS